jgi:hypothetical protein
VFRQPLFERGEEIEKNNIKKEQPEKANRQVKH